MKTIGNFTLSLLAIGMLQVTPALAADLSGLPPAQMHNGITYITGGIGQPESDAMKAAAGRYDLMLTFAERSGAYLAGVKVNIADRSGDTILDLISGPILLVDLPAGSYRVRADVAGNPLVKTIDIAGKTHRHVAYAWPNNIDERSEFSAFESEPMERAPSKSTGTSSGMSE
ncbi:hypothetical protein CCR95_18095 [Thiocystis minor]|uniref:hypothetical protein n=1 Tax=Thiocystis minor TaxID=61597 RepID=UPI00191206A2|nr:hypothetical protein [Thiocystis minor]MBK5965934.1 hypothetical protein [Thiocystis minor]